MTATNVDWSVCFWCGKRVEGDLADVSFHENACGKEKNRRIENERKRVNRNSK